MTRAPCIQTLILLLAVPAAAQAQVVDIGDPPVLFGEPCDRHRTHGYMGGQLMGIGALGQSALKTDRYLSRFGGGLGLFAGVRLGPHLALEGNWTFALHDEALPDLPQLDSHSIYIMTVTADLKAYLPTDSPMEPYLQVGGGLLMSGGVQLDERQGEQPDGFSTGATFSAGCGLDLWVTRHLAMGARVLYRGLALGENRDDRKDEQRFRNVIHGISVDAFATIHF